MITWIKKNIVWYFFSARRPKRVGFTIIDPVAFNKRLDALLREEDAS